MRILLLLFLAASSQTFASPACPLIGGVMQGQFERMRWLTKVARELRGGRSLDDCQSIELLKYSDSEIVDRLLDQPEFADAVLDFNLFYLGFRKDYVREASGELNPAVFDFPSALNSAREVYRGGDYFKIFEFEQPLFLPPLEPAEIRKPEDAKLSVEQNRRLHFEDIQSGLTKQIEYLREYPHTPIEQSCAVFLNEIREGFQWAAAGLYVPLMDATFKGNLWYGKVVEYCTGPFKTVDFDFRAELERIFAMNQKIFVAFADLEKSVYSTKSLANLRGLDVAAVGMTRSWNMFGTTHRQALQNSSTNFNRKRAAYMLSRFFCDDLTPINVESPKQHTQDRHGSEASCMACHYKLDPMAGYFRDFGIYFSSYSDNEKIRFDDNGAADRERYQSVWAGKNRAWNVGFIRSSSRENLNAYGETIEDLFATIRTEPEVKRCLVKRLFEYFVNDSQAIDAGWVEYLAAKFAAEVPSGSTRALKMAVKEVLLTKTFREPNPDPQQCYDYAPGYNPAGRPPCKVAYVFEKNCSSCHDGTYEEPYLDLTSWRQFSDGKYGFVHEDGQGNSRDRKETFAKILDRLQTEDVSRRMPLRRHMDPLDRETLFKWVNGLLNEH
jgi:hypothetical protein